MHSRAIFLVKLFALFVLGAALTAILVLTLMQCRAVRCMTRVTHLNEQQLVDRARDLISSGNYESGEAVFRKVLSYNPDNTQALIHLAGQLRHRGQYHESESIFLRVIALQPDDQFAYVDIGKLYRNMNDPEKALAMFKKAEAIDPNNPRLWSYGYAELFVTMNDYKKAEAADMKALSLDPNDHFAYMSLGNIYHSAGRYAEAEQAYLKSIELNPQSEAYFGLGYTFLKQNKLDESEAWFTKYIESFPAPRGETYNGLGNIAERRNQHFKAIRYFNYAHYLDSASFHEAPVERNVRRMKDSSRLLWLEGKAYALLTRHTAFLFDTLGIRA